jgi:hypothetical protein
MSAPFGPPNLITLSDLWQRGKCDGATPSLLPAHSRKLIQQRLRVLEARASFGERSVDWREGGAGFVFAGDASFFRHVRLAHARQDELTPGKIGGVVTERADSIAFYREPRIRFEASRHRRMRLGGFTL